jgi:Protein of unknown function (DUF2442)
MQVIVTSRPTFTLNEAMIRRSSGWSLFDLSIAADSQEPKSDELSNWSKRTARLYCEVGMSTLSAGVKAAKAQRVVITDDALIVDLSDGRTVSVPLAWFPRLLHGTVREQNHWQLIGNGEGIHWPDLDEDVSRSSDGWIGAAGALRVRNSRLLLSHASALRPVTSRIAPAPTSRVLSHSSLFCACCHLRAASFPLPFALPTLTRPSVWASVRSF